MSDRGSLVDQEILRKQYKFRVQSSLWRKQCLLTRVNEHVEEYQFSSYTGEEADNIFALGRVLREMIYRFVRVRPSRFNIYS